MWYFLYGLVAFSVFIGMLSENTYRLDEPPRMSVFTLICGCLFCGLVWPITVVFKVLCFLHHITNH